MEIRKEFELTVRGSGKPRIFKFRQATALETIEFIHEAKKDDFSPISWLFCFLNGKCTSERPFLRRENISKREFFHYVHDLDGLFNTVKKTYFRGAFGEKTDEWSAEWAPDGAYWAFLAEKLSIDPLSLLERYTFEQIAELAKGIVWNLNSQTEEGKRKNEAEKIRKKIGESDRDAIRETVDRLANYHKKP